MEYLYFPLIILSAGLIISIVVFIAEKIIKRCQRNDELCYQQVQRVVIIVLITYQELSVDYQFIVSSVTFVRQSGRGPGEDVAPRPAYDVYII